MDTTCDNTKVISFQKWLHLDIEQVTTE